MQRRRRRFFNSLVLGFAVAAFAAPAALAEPRGPGNSPNHSDFWNYDARTGDKVANTSPGVAAADVVGMYSGGTGIGSDDRSLYRGTSPQLDPSFVSSPDDRSVYRGVERPDAVGSNLSPGIRGEFVKTLDRPSAAPISAPTVSASSNDGFQWGDAGLGAASTLALVLLMGAAGLMIRHQRRRLAAY